MNKNIFLGVIFFLLIIIVVGYFFVEDTGKNTNNETQKFSNIDSEKETAFLECVSNYSNEELCGMIKEDTKQNLYKTCSTALIPDNSHDATIYEELSIVSINWYDYETDENNTLYLPWEPKSDFANCSESAKSHLTALLERQSN